MIHQETSLEAWASIQPHMKSVDAHIMHHCSRPGGATCAEIVVAEKLKHQTVSPNIRHLVKRGLLADTGDRRLNAGGRRCIVWGPPVAASKPESETLVRITGSGFATGVVLGDQGVFIAAPIVKFMMGWPLYRVLVHCKKKGWKAEVPE